MPHALNWNFGCSKCDPIFSGNNVTSDKDNLALPKRIISPVQTASNNCWYRIVEAKTKAVAGFELLRSSENGRFHRDAISEPTCYGADSVRTAWLEHTQDDQNPDVRNFRALALECPGTFCDLRLPGERERHQISAEELRTDPPSERCRDVARRLRQTGALGVIYWSNRDRDGTCIAIFLENTKDILRWREAVKEWNLFIASNGLGAQPWE
jgi:hypothetical protein